MGWGEFIDWLGVMRRQTTPVQADPGSWQGVEHDPEWQRMKAERDALLRR